MKRLPYSATLTRMAVTAARREFQQRGVQLVTRGARQYVVRTIKAEGLAILRNSRSWSAS